MIIEIPSFWAQKKYRLWLASAVCVCLLHFAVIAILLKKEVALLPQATAAVMVHFSDPPQSIVSIHDLPLGPPQMITQNSRILELDTPPQTSDNPLVEENPFIEQAEIVVKKQTKKTQQETIKANNKPRKKAKKADKPSNVNSIASGESVTAPPDGNNQQIAAEYNSEGSSRKLVSSWQARLLGHLGRYRHYPESALKQKIEGRPVVKITLDRQGKVLAVSLKKSSGSTTLDHAAINTVKRASPLPKPPENIIKQKATITFSLPIKFELKKGK